MADEAPPVSIPLRRLVIHLLFLGLAAYVAHETLWRLFAETPLSESDGGRRTPLGLLVIIVTATASWLFNLIYPLALRAPGASDQAHK